MIIQYKVNIRVRSGNASGKRAPERNRLYIRDGLEFNDELTNEILFFWRDLVEGLLIAHADSVAQCAAL